MHPSTRRETEIQAQAEDVSQIHSQEQPYFRTPTLLQIGRPPFSKVQMNDITDIPATERAKEVKVCQLQEDIYRVNKPRAKSHLEVKENITNPHSEDVECNQSLSKPTASESKFFKKKRERGDETSRKIVDKDKMKGQFEFTAPHREIVVSSPGAVSEDRWEQSLQQNNMHVWTPKHPTTMYESNLVQLFVTPTSPRDNRVSPQAWRNQEVIVSFKTVNDHIGRVSDLNMEILSTGCDETKTHFPLCQCNKSRPGSNTGSNWVKGQKQAAATAAVCHSAPNSTSQASTSLKHSTFPMHSTTRSTSSSGSSIEGEDNPSSQCHQLPKLPSPPPHLGLQDSHFILSAEDYASDAPSEAEEGWMIQEIQKGG
ncbi:uncharacterized protein LOC111565459 [Amphiprion ocellaris]|uniref:uncharacterized protein LOC111565459 n=1 Tax=Amphiprion ocellaris TaxID=80972 RepID=UPI0024113F6C|nr:uncharacterized protein LOC111565459 [Amphiprion ocellaris]